jgi:hypothetical protein
MGKWITLLLSPVVVIISEFLELLAVCIVLLKDRVEKFG